MDLLRDTDAQQPATPRDASPALSRSAHVTFNHRVPGSSPGGSPLFKTDKALSRTGRNG
jgi:hypothetical protein